MGFANGGNSSNISKPVAENFSEMLLEIGSSPESLTLLAALMLLCALAAFFTVVAGRLLMTVVWLKVERRPVRTDEHNVIGREPSVLVLGWQTLRIWLLYCSLTLTGFVLKTLLSQ
ncbi:MAG: hypothetical protein RBR49_12440 [Desulfovibrio desulfuricans]|jgi:hypothetical protein|nr:hypothetical protein [Desulfovibrio desulfuricans]